MAANDQCIPLTEQFGGYDDAVFIDPPDQSSGLLCPVCFLVLREPHLMSCCGKHLCRMCLSRVETDDKPCPCCNGLDFRTLFDKGKNGVILGLKVYCANRGIGCNWTGELGDMNRHIETKCVYAMSDCPFGCGQCIPRHSIPNHTERECSKRPIEVQLKCLSMDMEERLRAIEVKYEEKVAELEKSNTALEATVKEQERKLEEQEKELSEHMKELIAQKDHKMVYEEKMATFEATMKEFSKSMATLEEQQKKLELKTEVESERRKLADQNKRLVALEQKLIEQRKASEKDMKRKDDRLSEGLQQLKKVQKVHEDRLTALKGSNDSCINELRKIEKHLKEVDSELSCEAVTVPVSLGKITYIKSHKCMPKTGNEVHVSEDLNGPDPVIKIRAMHSIDLQQKLMRAQSELTRVVSSLVTEMFWFPPEKEEVFQYLFGEEKKWEKLAVGYDVETVFIPNQKPFTVEVCGKRRNQVRGAIDELKIFKDNRPYETSVQVSYYLLTELREYADCKLVTLNEKGVRQSGQRYTMPDSTYIVNGGRYDVQLVCDFIEENDSGGW